MCRRTNAFPARRPPGFTLLRRLPSSPAASLFRWYGLLFASRSPPSVRHPTATLRPPFTTTTLLHPLPTTHSTPSAATFREPSPPSDGPPLPRSLGPSFVHHPNEPSPATHSSPRFSRPSFTSTLRRIVGLSLGANSVRTARPYSASRPANEEPSVEPACGLVRKSPTRSAPFATDVHVQ